MSGPSLEQFMTNWPGEQPVASEQPVSSPQRAISPRTPQHAWMRSGEQATWYQDFQGPYGGTRPGFAAASRDRTVADFYPAADGINRMLSRDGALMRQRARYLVDSNPHAYAAVDAYVANVLETGIVPRPNLDDRGQRSVITDTWKRWGGLTAMQDSEADPAASATIYDLMGLWFSESFVAGGCLLHRIELLLRGRRQIPVAVELLPEDRFADDADVMIGANPKTRTVINGIEIDPATRRAIRYWVRKTDPNDVTAYDPEPMPLPAEDCRYALCKPKAGQIRGLTHLRAAILYLWRLGIYTDNEMIASGMKSSWAYAITSKDDSADLPWDGNEPTDAYGQPIRWHQGGQVFQARPGESINAVGPNVPSDNHDWLTHIERAIGMAVGQSRIALTRDVGEANLSAARYAANEDRRRYRRWQAHTINHFCHPVYRWMMEGAVRAGIAGFPSPAAFLSGREEWLRVKFRAPGWSSVNPLQDAQANQINILTGCRSRSDVTGELHGAGDVEETFEQLGREELHADTLGIPIHGAPEQPAAAEEADPPGTHKSGRRTTGGGR